jgi:hypothetical protein
MIRLLGAAAVRALFITAAIVALVLNRASDLSWSGPIFVITLLVLIALVRYATEAYAKWAAEFVTWLDTADVDAWTTWHRENVTYLAAKAARTRP